MLLFLVNISPCVGGFRSPPLEHKLLETMAGSFLSSAVSSMGPGTWGYLQVFVEWLHKVKESKVIPHCKEESSNQH